jgi:Ca-activated chloride channel family protein
LWPAARAFDDRTLEEASGYIERIEADLGGTEILAPLSASLEAKPDPERPRRVLVLTDGQVSNEAQILALAREHVEKTRIFAFGIGAAASEHLVRGVARASRGAAEMIFPGERIEPKVMRMFERVRMPVLEAHVDWRGLSVEQAPSRVPPVFAGEALTVFARILAGSTPSVELVVGERRFSVALDLERAELGGPIPLLWAREVIRELDDETSPRGSAQHRPEADARRRNRLVELGMRYGLMSSATSYVAVEERAPSDQTQSPAELRRIPVALSTGWGGTQGPAAKGAVSRGGIRSILFGSAPRAAAAPAFFKRRKASAANAPEHEAQSGASPATPDPLYELLMTQSAAGSFAKSAVFMAWLAPAAAARLAQALATQDERLVVTAVVVLLLERQQPDRQSEWRPAVNKANAWLAKQSARFDPSSVLG